MALPCFLQQPSKAIQASLNLCYVEFYVMYSDIIMGCSPPIICAVCEKALHHPCARRCTLVPCSKCRAYLDNIIAAKQPSHMSWPWPQLALHVCC